MRKRSDIQLISQASQHKFRISKPNFKRFKIFEEELVGVEMLPTRVKLDKPLYVGASILDLSKNLMYGFWYQTLKRRYRNIQLCFTGKYFEYSHHFVSNFSKLSLHHFVNQNEIKTTCSHTLILKNISDTDSFLFSVETENFYNDMREMRSRNYDTSNYPSDHPLYSTENKSIPGYFKVSSYEND